MGFLNVPYLEFAVLTKTNQAKRQKPKREYRGGPEARENCERTMKAPFQVPKVKSMDFLRLLYRNACSSKYRNRVQNATSPCY